MKTIKSTYLRTNKSKNKATLVIEHLNLGNNFTYTHFVDAIKERAQQDEKLQDALNKLEFINLDFELKVIANGNFSKVEDNFCIDEFFELLK